MMRPLFPALTALAALMAAAAASVAQAPSVSFSMRSAKSGAWSDAATWAEKRVPRAGDLVNLLEIPQVDGSRAHDASKR